MGCVLSRLFKFPQMDFEMAIWEMTSLLIAPKKVFKSMYYHVCRSLPLPRVLDTNLSDPRNVRIPLALTSVLLTNDSNTCLTRNEKHMAPTRPLIHIPPLLLPPPHSPRLGHRIQTQLWRNCPPVPLLYIPPLHRHVARGVDDSILLRWEGFRAKWSCGGAQFVARRAIWAYKAAGSGAGLVRSTG